MFAASAFSGVFLIIAVGERQRGRLFYSACFLKRGENGPFSKSYGEGRRAFRGQCGASRSPQHTAQNMEQSSWETPEHGMGP